MTGKAHFGGVSVLVCSPVNSAYQDVLLGRRSVAAFFAAVHTFHPIIVIGLSSLQDKDRPVYGRFNELEQPVSAIYSQIQHLL